MKTTTTRKILKNLTTTKGIQMSMSMLEGLVYLWICLKNVNNKIL